MAYIAEFVGGPLDGQVQAFPAPLAPDLRVPFAKKAHPFEAEAEPSSIAINFGYYLYRLDRWQGYQPIYRYADQIMD